MNSPTPGPLVRLVLASHNPGKLREIRALLAPFGVTAQAAPDLGLGEPEETGQSFLENARIKALAVAQASGLPALADDSGLWVDALNGAPGIYSARWAGPEKDFPAAMKRIQNELGGSPNRRAHFACALCLAWPDGKTIEVEGRVEGDLTWPPRGEKGFGYDPIFVPEGKTVTFAEMDLPSKQAISHRADAFRKLVAICFPAP